MEGLHGLARVYINLEVLSMLSNLMRAGYTKPRVYLEHIFLVSLVKVDIAADRLVHLSLATTGCFRDNDILIGLLLLLLKDGSCGVQEGATVFAAQEGECVPDAASLGSEYRHFYIILQSL